MEERPVLDNTTLLQPLLDYRLPGLDFGPDSVLPQYTGRSLANLPASICRLLAAPPLGAPVLDPDLLSPLEQACGGTPRHVVLILVDGLGWDLLAAARAAAPALGLPDSWADPLKEATRGAITSIAPSTTASALTTLWTGLPPAAHAITGYEIWLKEYGILANAITHAPVRFSGETGILRKAGLLPETFLRVPTLGLHLARAGVMPFAYHTHALAHSSLSTMLLPEVTSLGYRSLNELWVSLRANLRDSGSARTYSYVYLADIDELSHRYGPGDERVTREITALGRQMSQLLALLRAAAIGKTLVLLAADHGELPTPPDPRYDLNRHPALLDCLVMPPSGEARLAYLYLRAGASHEETARRYIESTWPGEFRLFSARALLEGGLLGGGEIAARAAERVGDLIAVAQGSAYWWWGAKENTLQGRHGGLTREEMIVPLFGWGV